MSLTTDKNGVAGFIPSVWDKSLAVGESNLPLSAFIEPTLDDLIQIRQAKLPDTSHRAIRNIMTCGKKLKVCKCPIQNCEHQSISLFLCRNKLCKHEVCVNQRVKRATQRLNQWNWRQNETFIQFTLGTSKKNIKDYHDFEKTIHEILTRLKRGNKIKKRTRWNLGIVSIFDIGRKKYLLTDNDGDLWYHRHIITPNRQRFFPFKKFINDLQSIINDINPKYRLSMSKKAITSKKRTFDYFSKRIAGLFGHQKDGYFSYEDIISDEDYFQHHHRAKVMRYSLPEGFIYNKCPSLPKPSCPQHHENLIFAYYQRLEEFYQSYNNGKPPSVT